MYESVATFFGSFFGSRKLGVLFGLGIAAFDAQIWGASFGSNLGVGFLGWIQGAIWGRMWGGVLGPILGRIWGGILGVEFRAQVLVEIWVGFLGNAPSELAWTF